MSVIGQIKEIVLSKFPGQFTNQDIFKRTYPAMSHMDEDTGKHRHHIRSAISSLREHGHVKMIAPGIWQRTTASLPGSVEKATKKVIKREATPLPIKAVKKVIKRKRKASANQPRGTSPIRFTSGDNSIEVSGTPEFLKRTLNHLANLVFDHQPEQTEASPTVHSRPDRVRRSLAEAHNLAPRHQRGRRPGRFINGRYIAVGKPIPTGYCEMKDGRIVLDDSRADGNRR